MRCVRYDEKKQMYEELSRAKALHNVCEYEASVYSFLARHPHISRVVLAYEEVLADPDKAVLSLSALLNLKTNTRNHRKVIELVSSQKAMSTPKW